MLIACQASDVEVAKLGDALEGGGAPDAMKSRGLPLAAAAPVTDSRGMIAPSASGSGGRPSQGREKFVPSELIVKLRSTEQAVVLHRQGRGGLRTAGAGSASRVAERLSRAGAHTTRQILPTADQENLRRLLKVEGVADIRAAIAELSALPDVEYAEPNRVVEVVFSPNDPLYSTSGSWGQAYADLWGLQKLNAASAWDLTQGAGIVVAVTDTGLDYHHPDIAPNVWQNSGELGSDAGGRDKRSNGLDDDNNGFVDDWRGYNFVSASNDPMDDHGHGTHVSGTIAAVGNNAQGVIGVAPAARIMALRALGTNGDGSLDGLISAIYYAANNGAQVINASWGGVTEQPVLSLDEAIAYAHDTKGVVFVAAAGNSNLDLGTGEFEVFPANNRNAITVAASDHLDGRASFSNFGVKLDVTAPGGGDDPTGSEYEPGRSVLSLLSTQAAPVMTGNGQLVVAERYLRQSGTSMAAPHVAGVAALIRARSPAFSAEQVRQAIRKGSNDVQAPGADVTSGYGRLNARNSLEVAAPLEVQLLATPGLLSGVSAVDLRGTVQGVGLTGWRLEYGAGSAPASWTLIKSGTSAITKGLLTSWNVRPLSDGQFVVRLLGTKSGGQTFEDRLPVTVRNLELASPSPELANWFGGVVDVVGTAASPSLSRYAVEIFNDAGAPVANANVVLANGGTQPITDGKLATWNVSGLPAGYYRLRVTAFLTTGASYSRETRGLYDPTMHAGWPVKIPDTGAGVIDDEPSQDILASAFIAADVDQDGDLDIPVALGWGVFLYDHTGAQLPGWPRMISDYEPAQSRIGVQRVPAVGDIDGDGRPEVVVSSISGNVYAFHADGSLLPGFPVQLGGQGGLSAALGDISGDGKADIVAVAGSQLAVIDSRGNVLPGWPLAAPTRWNPPALGDIDNDGRIEIVAEQYGSGVVHVFGANGVEKAGWPRSYGGEAATLNTPNPMVLSDLDGDAKLELIIAAHHGTVHVFKSNGTYASGWPRALEDARPSGPVVGDLNRDGRPEIVIALETVLTARGTMLESVYALQGNGAVLPGWPAVQEWPHDGSRSFWMGMFGPALVDIDLDGVPEVFVSMDSDDPADPHALMSYRADGTPAPGFPKRTPHHAQSQLITPAIADFDGDSRLEVLWSSFSKDIALLDLDAPAGGVAPWPMFHGNPSLSGSASSAPVSSDLFKDDFESGASAWTPLSGSWSVSNDGSKVFRQSTASGNARAAANAGPWTNQMLSARIKVQSFNGSDRFLALFGRLQDANNYYFLSMRSSNKLELKKLVNGSSTTLASKSFPVSLNRWYTVKLEISGSTLRGYVDGTLQLSATDSKFASGKVGLGTFNATAVFDDVTVTP